MKFSTIAQKPFCSIAKLKNTAIIEQKPSFSVSKESPLTIVFEQEILWLLHALPLPLLHQPSRPSAAGGQPRIYCPKCPFAGPTPLDYCDPTKLGNDGRESSMANMVRLVWSLFLLLLPWVIIITDDDNNNKHPVASSALSNDKCELIISTKFNSP